MTSEWRTVVESPCGAIDIRDGEDGVEMRVVSFEGMMFSISDIRLTRAEASRVADVLRGAGI